jgi:protein gp37
MAGASSIEWTEATWNPIAGCLMVSPGCTNCYAMRMAGRLEAIGVAKYRGDPAAADAPRRELPGRDHRHLPVAAGLTAYEIGSSARSKKGVDLLAIL